MANIYIFIQHVFIGMCLGQNSNPSRNPSLIPLFVNYMKTWIKDLTQCFFRIQHDKTINIVTRFSCVYIK